MEDKILYYANNIKNIINEAKNNGIEIQSYITKCKNKEVIIEQGIAIYRDDPEESIKIPTYKN